MDVEIDLSGEEDSGIDITQDVNHAVLGISGLDLTLNYDHLENLFNQLKPLYQDDLLEENNTEKNIINFKQKLEEKATKKGMDALDILCEQWAKETNVDGLIAKFTSDLKTHAKIRELMMISHLEGLYRGRTSATEFKAERSST